MTLHRDSVTALYMQIAEGIERQIREGDCPPFSKLPSEQEMVARYGVSRVTVRQALGVLLRKGLVEAKQGKGTFVVGAVLQHGLDRLMGFYDSLVAQGQKPRTSLLEFGPATPAQTARTVFHGRADAAPVALKRLYQLKGRPFAVVEALITPEAASVTRAQAESMTIYRIVAEILGAEIAHADIGIRASVVGKRNGELLKLAPQRPVLVMERVSKDAAGRALEHSFFYVVPETYEFRLGVFGPLDISRGIRRVSPGDARADLQTVDD